MSAVAELVVKITSDVKDATKGISSVEGTAGKMKAGIQKAALPAAAALAAVGAAAIAAGNAAAEDEQSQAILANTMEKTTGAHAKQVAAMEDYISSVSKATGVTDDELRPAMGNLLRATGDAKKSQEAMNKVLDVSAATGKDVESVSQAVAKAYGGSTGSLKKLVPSLSDATLKTGDMSKIMAELADQTGGAAAAAADTAAGKMKKMQTQMGEAQEEIGSALLPVMAKFADVLANVANWISQNTTVFYIIVAAIAALAAAVLVANAAIAIYTVVTAIAGAVSASAWLAAALPIIAVVAAVLLVVGAVVLLWKKSETFRNIVLGVWEAIKTAATTVATAVKAAWVAVWTFLTGAAQGFATAVGNVWTAVKTGVTTIVNWVKTAWSNLWDAVANGARDLATAVANVWTLIKNSASELAGKIGSILQGAWDAVKNGASKAVDEVVAFFKGLPARITSALSGASSLLTGIGHDLIAGLVSGIEAAKGWLMDRVNSIADSIPGWLKKRLGIGSPSKVTAVIGKDVTAGLVLGMGEGLADVKTMSEKVATFLTEAISNKIKSDKKAKAATKTAIASLGNETAALEKNAKKRAAVYRNLATQQDALAKAKESRAQYAAAVADSAKAFGSITNLTDKEATSADAMLADMQARVAKVITFQANLKALAGKGLSKSMIDDLAQAGVEAAGAQAQALADSGPDQIAAFNSLQATLDTASATLGDQTAGSMYDAGIAATQALVDGLLADKKTLEDTAEQLAADLAEAMKKALEKLNIKVKVKGGPKVKASPSNVVALSSAPSLRGLGATSRAGGATAMSGNTYVINGALDPEGVARQIGAIQRGHGRRMGGSGRSL